MQNPKFLVRKPRGPKPKEGFPAFVLEQDNWNDYSFQTLYHLSYCDVNKSGIVEETHIGPVKILRRGQTKGDGLQISQDFIRLSEQFCSVGQSLDYYERINSFETELKEYLLTSMRDAVFSPDLAVSFSEEAGWSTSLFRDQTDEGLGFLALAKGIITGEYKTIPHESMTFSFRMPNWENAVVFKFSAPDSTEWHRSALPERLAVLVGKNGSGKSTLLARLARVAFGNLDDRSKAPLSNLGIIEPAGVGFPRIITITFSPFDSFRLPGSDSRNRKQIIKDLQYGDGRYIFIGIRDVVAESTSRGVSQKVSDTDEADLGDRLGRTHLKSIQALADEFISSLERIFKKKREQSLVKLIDDLFDGTPFEDIEFGSEAHFLEEARTIFLKCSTGYKIALLMVTGLLANIEPFSLILIDEPETHLHPPLLASLMHGIRKILSEHRSFGIVATHSPVVVQETLAQHVRIIRREGELHKALPVSGETFGESIGLISAEVFGLQTDATDFHRILDQLIKQDPDLEEIESFFLNGALSHQARAYVMSQLSNQKKK